jgi:hypothetical protein
MCVPPSREGVLHVLMLVAKRCTTGSVTRKRPNVLVCAGTSYRCGIWNFQLSTFAIFKFGDKSISLVALHTAHSSSPFPCVHFLLVIVYDEIIVYLIQ